MGAISGKAHGNGQEVASAVAYLASNEASYVTGQTPRQWRHGDDLTTLRPAGNHPFCHDPEGACRV